MNARSDAVGPRWKAVLARPMRWWRAGRQAAGPRRRRRPGMRLISTKNRIAVGQAGLAVCLVLTASFIGLVPDRNGAILAGRASLAEMVAANISALAKRGDMRGMEAQLRFVVERNADLRSAAVRQGSSGDPVVAVGEHEQHWRAIEEGYSTGSQLQVAIWGGNRQWGHLELRFAPLAQPGWRGVLGNPVVQFVGFIAIAGFLSFNFFLGRVLKQLDPSQAIPARVRSALDTMAEGLLVLDRKENVVLANQAFASMADKTPDGLLGYNIKDFPWRSADGAPLESADCPWNKALRDGAAQRNVVVRVQWNDTLRSTYQVNCAPVLSDDGKPNGVLVSFDDVTRLEQKEIELRKSKEEAEAANHAKSAFLANMSHEIRTPMNAILGFAEILRRGYGRDQRATEKYLNTILSSGKHLLELINDILDLSKIEAGRIEVERLDCAPYAILQEVVHVLGAKAQEKGISLVLEADGAIPETICSDPARLRQIVTNLVGNAIKFTEQGGVRVVARLSGPDHGRQLAIDVIDTGIGIPEDKLAAVFNPFEQADTSTTRRFGGTGLGLSISRQLAQALGGDVTVRSSLGAGSVFTASVATGPLDGVRLAQPAELPVGGATPDEATRQHWEFPPRRVLVVDDGAENRELVTLVLEELGLRVDQAVNGKEGVDKAAATQYDAILMDVQMPVMDGFTAARLLRERGSRTPIIALTAHAMKGFEQQCLANGYTGYMTKPIDIDALTERLAELLDGRRAGRVARATATAGTARRAPTPEPADSAGPPIVSRLAASNPRFRGLIERFSRQLGANLAAMEEACRRDDFAELARLAHWLKGSGGTVGFDAFTVPAQDLERFAKEGSAQRSAAALAVVRTLADRIEVGSGAPVSGRAAPKAS